MFCLSFHVEISKHGSRFFAKRKPLKRGVFVRFERSEKRVLSYLDTYRNNVVFVFEWRNA